LIVLDHVGAARLGRVRVLAGVAASPTLAQEVPKLVELDFEVLEATSTGFVEAVAGMLPLEAVLLLYQLVYAADEFGISQVYARAVLVRHRHRSSLAGNLPPAENGGCHVL
jgi:hypothetical protein